MPRAHSDWLHAVFDPEVEIGALSMGRGGGKTTLASKLAAVALTPGSVLWRPELEVLAVSASLAQSRPLVTMLRNLLDSDDYSIADSDQRISVTHRSTGARFRVLSSSGKRALGLSTFSLILFDEPGSLDARNGEVLYDACRQSLGKLPDQRLLFIGTRAPAAAEGWWPQLLDDGSGDGVHVVDMHAGEDLAWDSYTAVKAANPLVTTVATLRRRILRERDQARRNPSLRASYEAYRLNRAGDPSATRLVQVEDWRAVEARAVPARSGRPVVALDLGGERSWSAGWVLWRNGRSEAYAACPGVPELHQREKADAMASGTYQRLADTGALTVDVDRNMARPEVLVGRMVDAGVRPEVVVCDTFALGGLRDACRSVGWPPPVCRRARWSEASEDIASFRQLVLDGPLSLVAGARGLARLGLSQIAVATDDQGSTRLIKRRGDRSRDDVAQAAVLAAGELVRRQSRPQRRQPRLVLVGQSA